MARQIHGVDGEFLCEKRRQRSEIFELGIDGMEDDQRWAIARHLVAEGPTEALLLFFLKSTMWYSKSCCLRGEACQTGTPITGLDPTGSCACGNRIFASAFGRRIRNHAA